MVFTWNKDKYLSNIRKDHLSFEFAATIFDDQMVLTDICDETHSSTEPRYYAIGWIEHYGGSTVSYTMRGDTYRLMSARIATRQEKKLYKII